MTAEAQSVPMEIVVIGKRRREDLGDLRALAESIETYGLLHPIVIDEAFVLIAGERRFNACRMLGWSSIPARNLGDLTEEERREIEDEENRQRKDLTDYEWAKDLTTRAPAVAEVLATNLVAKTPRGQQPTYAVPKKDVAQALGVSTSELVRAEQQMEAAETYPFMQSPDWSQNAVLTARKHLEAMPEPVREAVAELVSEPGVPVRDGLQIIANVREMPAEQQETIVTLHHSPDHRERDRAMTTAAAKPPMPDPQLTAIGNAVRELQTCVRKYPDDPWTDRLRWLIEQMGEVQEAIREQGRKQP